MTFFNKKYKKCSIFFCLMFLLYYICEVKSINNYFVNYLIIFYYEQNRISKRYCLRSKIN